MSSVSFIFMRGTIVQILNYGADCQWTDPFFVTSRQRNDFLDMWIVLLLVIDNNNQTGVYCELRFVLKANIVRVAWSLVFCVMFCRSLFVHFFCCCCVVWPSIWGFCLPLWYLQTILSKDIYFIWLSNLST